MDPKILERLAKLKSLAECKTGNPNEVASAAEAMLRLMLQYQVAESDIPTTERIDYVDPMVTEVVYNAQRMAPWESILANCVSKMSQCLNVKIIGQGMSFTGPASRVQMAKIMFNYLRQQATNLGARKGSSFRHGIAVEVSRRVNEMYRTETGEAGLVLYKSETDKARDFFTNSRNTKITESSRKISLNSASVEAGKRAGQLVDLDPRGTRRIGGEKQKALPAKL